MKVIILAGGLGTRFAEYTDALPEPAARIGRRPILWRIMQIDSHFGHKDYFLGRAPWMPEP